MKKPKYKVKNVRKLKGGGKYTTLCSSATKEEIRYVESGGDIFFVGITKHRVKIGDRTTIEIIKENLNANIKEV